MSNEQGYDTGMWGTGEDTTAEQQAYLEGKADAYKECEQRMAQLENPWISVDEPPEVGEVVYAEGLIHGEYGYTPTERGCRRMKYTRDGWRLAEAEPRYWRGMQVARYARLPEPPK